MRCRCARTDERDDETADNVLKPIHTALYLVATPIGNLQDITLRALNVLRGVDVIAAEDTRRTRVLLSHYAIPARLFSLHAHNETRAGEKLIALLKEGKSVALVSDAGTPAVSDPGAKVVQQVRGAGFPVVPVPGANAALAAFSASGLQASRVLLCGFLPRASNERKALLEELKSINAALVFYEAPHRIVAALHDIADVLGKDRPAVIARELTKMYESFFSAKLSEVIEWLGRDEDNRKGEFVIVVDSSAKTLEVDDRETERILATLIAELPLKQAASLAAQITGASKKRLYALGLTLKSG